MHIIFAVFCCIMKAASGYGKYSLWYSKTNIHFESFPNNTHFLSVLLTAPHTVQKRVSCAAHGKFKHIKTDRGDSDKSLVTNLRVTSVQKFLFCCHGICRVECGGFVLLKNLEDTRTITTPDYPTNYPNFTRCIWLVETSRNHLVSITFTLDVEKHLGFCTDTLQVSDTPD